MPTTAGSFALLGMPVKKDAYVVRRLKEAGAISESLSLVLRPGSSRRPFLSSAQSQTQPGNPATQDYASFVDTGALPLIEIAFPLEFYANLRVQSSAKPT